MERLKKGTKSPLHRKPGSPAPLLSKQSLVDCCVFFTKNKQASLTPLKTNEPSELCPDGTAADAPSPQDAAGKRDKTVLSTALQRQNSQQKRQQFVPV